MKEITSTKNPLVKYYNELLSKSKMRVSQGEFVFEGLRELTLAIQGGYTIEQVLFVPEILSITTLNSILMGIDAQVIIISEEVYKKLSYRSSTEGVIALGKMKSHSLEDIEIRKENPLILVAEASEKPGNIGALLRTADAAGLDAVLIANPKTELYNPNIIRSSVGCVFTTTVGLGSSSEVISFLKKNDIAIYCTALTASKPYTEVNYIRGSAIVVGTEDTGLTQEWLEASSQNIIIPMSGIIDSLNVSVAAGITIFEAVRQRSKV